MKSRSWLYTAIILPIALLASAAAGCASQSPAPSPSADRETNITVSIVPQQYFVERIGGEHVQTSVMVLPGSNPATYEPKPEQMEALSRADAYMSIGVPFEGAWMERIRSANGEMLVVDTTQGIERMAMTADHAHEGEEHAEHEGEEEGENLDPHIWTSPALVKIQAQTIHDALVQLDPEHEAAFRANLDAFLADVNRLEADIRDALTEVKSNKFIVFHPSWAYFARDFGLEMIPIEIEGKEPSAAEMAQLVAEATEEGIRVVFAQPEFSTRSAATIASEIGGEVLLISPLAYDWLDNLHQVAATLQTCWEIPEHRGFTEKQQSCFSVRKGLYSTIGAHR